MNTQLGWTTLEQSMKLIEAGFDHNTADMYYYYKDSIPQITDNVEQLKANINSRFYTPCWSLGRLIELMPFNPTINGIKVFFQLNQIGCRYTYRDDDLSIKEVVVFANSNLIDNVISMVCWLLKNNYIKKGETK